ncbi:MAG: right-handed parallel beta-helix repeat-containing protein [Planctomycetota bacterium]|nr:right-handed parallel beta-helix repeat-containing protein [Planctomycetota bacterium]
MWRGWAKWLAAVGAVVGCWYIGTSPAQPESRPATAKAEKDARPVMAVATAEEFVKAIGPDRIIELAPGQYNLTKLTRRKLDHVRWTEAIDGEYDLHIRDCPRLEIRGAGKEPVHIVINAGYASVLNFHNCPSLTLSNLELGHEKILGYCTGGVVVIEGTTGVMIDRCLLYGCGIEGLTLTKVKDLTFRDSTVEKCTNNILVARDCDKLAFERSVFRRCTQYGGFDFVDCMAVTFTDCQVEGNAVREPLFKTNLNADEARIIFTGGAIRRNTAKELASPANMLTIKDADVKDNSWQATEEVRNFRSTISPLPGGGRTYITGPGVSSFSEVSHLVYGSIEHRQALEKANPKITEPIQADTSIFCPDNPPKDVGPEKG